MKEWGERTQTKVREQVGLNDFEYSLSLHVSSAGVSPAEVTSAFSLAPDRSHRAGEKRLRRDGKPLEGAYSSNYWGRELGLIDGIGLVEQLEALAVDLRAHSELLRAAGSELGEVELFVGLFTRRMCDFAMPPALLGDLSDLGITLRFDCCPCEDDSHS